MFSHIQFLALVSDANPSNLRDNNQGYTVVAREIFSWNLSPGTFTTSLIDSFRSDSIFDLVHNGNRISLYTDIHIYGLVPFYQRLRFFEHVIYFDQYFCKTMVILICNHEFSKWTTIFSFQTVCCSYIFACYDIYLY